jgi:hypothetical protein
MRAFRLLVTVPAWVLLGAALSFLLVQVGPDLPLSGATILGTVGSVLALALVVSPLAVLFAAKFLRDRVQAALAVRACDVEVAADELRVVGGRAHGFVASLSGLGAASSVQCSARELTVRRPDGVTLRVPMPPDADERASLEALASALGATAHARAHAGAVPARQPPDLLRCRGCGAPLPLAGGGAVRCPYCQAETPLPAELAAKVLAAERLQHQHARDQELCRALLQQPSARVANWAAFTSGALVIVTAWVAAAISGAFLVIDGYEAGLPRLGGLGLILIGLALLPIAFVRRVLGSRRALRVLTLGFAATPPARAGELFSCRNCGGPLPEVEPRVLLSRCHYCRAENLRLADWRVQAGIVERFAGGQLSPAEALRPMTQVRRRAVWLGLAGVAAIALGCSWLVQNPKLPPLGEAVVWVPYEASRAPLERAPVTAFDPRVAVHEEAAFPGSVAALIPAANGFVSALIPGARSTRVVDAPRGAVAPDALAAAREVPHAARYSSHAANAPLLWAAAGRVSCLEASGKQTVLYGGGAFSDALIADVSSASGCTGYVTTRASREGHLRLRFLDGSGTRVVRADARQAQLSPNGRDVAVTLLDPAAERFQLALWPHDGRGSGKLLTRGSGHVAHPVWSPDGTRIAFLSEPVRDATQFSVRRGRVRLFMIDLRGQLVQLTSGGDLALLRPVWTERGIHVIANGSRTRRSLLLRVTPPAAR